MYGADSDVCTPPASSARKKESVTLLRCDLTAEVHTSNWLRSGFPVFRTWQRLLRNALYSRDTRYEVTFVIVYSAENHHLLYFIRHRKCRQVLQTEVSECNAKQRDLHVVSRWTLCLLWGKPIH